MKLSGILIASVLLLSAPAFAQDRRPAHPPPTVEESTHYGWADVLRVDPVYDDNEAATPLSQSAERQSAEPDCYEEQVAPPPPPAAHADNRVGGTVVGAIVGGVIGSLFGKGDGRKATIAAGAVAGGVVGNNIAADDAGATDAVVLGEAGATSPAAVKRRCADLKNAAAQRRIVSYDVEYRYRGEIYLARLAYDPGDRLRVKVSVLPAD
jgi:uncharacterized protein YcfJ